MKEGMIRTEIIKEEKKDNETIEHRERMKERQRGRRWRDREE
jgi:hypothetical protein